MAKHGTLGVRFREARMALYAATACLCICALPASGQDPAAEAAQTYQTTCAICHTIGGGTLLGPDLEGIRQRRDERWLIDFIQHSQQMVTGGDSIAAALFEEFNGIAMPDNQLTDAQVVAILDFIESGAAVSTAPAEPLAPASNEQVLLGQALFQGTEAFTNGGPTCNACHDVANDAVIGGGILAVQLTDVFSRLGGPGVRAVLGSPPFPVMQQAYADKPLTDDEVVALVGFLEQADQEQSLHQPRDYGIQLFGAGVLGSVVLMGLYTLTWNGRKRGSVNQLIFDRQVKST